MLIIHIFVSVSEPEQDKKYSFEELNQKIEYDEMSYIGLLREAFILYLEFWYS